ncbi:MlaD family protein [Ramlibacter algicola]|uniref:MCE family protein n=1 Tax=Ramlibacter algicola TaxID=2795217 RepID=A0A934PZ36_9BURK|nr:MlaD family protein [Ramlibacter algicola]MBK0391697.1 MCE family protein [Ramlibacter algicola]
MERETPLQDSEPGGAAPVRNLALKARLLLAFTVVLIGASVLYLLYARGAFEATQRLVLTTDNAEGVYVGMDLTFSGFPIGRVRQLELDPKGDARLLIDVASKDAHWLRTSSVFTLERGLVGAPALRAFTGMLTDPLLADGAERQVLRGDASAEIPRVVTAAREMLENITQITAQDAALRNSLANVQAVTDRLKGPQGVLGVLLGNDQDAKRLLATLDRTNALLARLESVASHADTQVFGPDGLVRDARGTVNQLNGLLADTRGSLKKLDAVLVEAQGVGSNVKTATEDLGALRGEVEANLRKIDALINEINRKWPFARDTEVKVP